MAATVVVTGVGVIAGVDPLAAVIIGAGITAAIVSVRRQERKSLVRSSIGAFAVITLVGLLAASAIDANRSRPTALVIGRQEALRTRVGGHTVSNARDMLQPPPGTLTALGFAASDYDDTAAGVDRAAASLSVVAATGLRLGTFGGTLISRSATDSLVRAHLGGSAALITVTNENGVDFDPSLAMKVLGHEHAEDRLISAITTEVGRDGWDGVVVDFEQLPAAARASFPEFLAELREALGHRMLLVSVPVFTDGDPDATAYDLPAIASHLDRVVLMTYDQHDPTGPAGPIGGLPWSTDIATRAAKQVAPAKLMLGLAGYGYRWHSAGNADELTFTQFAALRSDARNTTTWDPRQGEWHVRLPDGEEAWFQDSISAALRSQLALRLGLSGVAMWRLGSEDPATWSTAVPVAPGRMHPRAPDRPVEGSAASGVVALTFDDGPDPTWTPRILDILHGKHVPATFFVIGNRARQWEDLVKREVRSGDVVGNHTYDHADLAKKSPALAKLDILAGAEVVEGITGHKPLLFRSPYGEADTQVANVTPPDQMAQNLGFRPISWNDDPEDWSRPGADRIVERAVAQAGERTVILLHDAGGDRSETIRALPHLIDALRARGYLFTTVDALDGSVRSPYIARHTVGDRARGVAIVAAFRLTQALGRVIGWTLVLVVVLSLLRLLACVPLALLHRRREQRVGPSPTAAPRRVTAVVPAHDEETVIAKTLASLRHLDWHDLEVIVVDDGSTDSTARIAEESGARVIRQEQSGKATALNTGIGSASGEIVVVIDADTVLEADFLQRVIPHFDDDEVVAVAGNVKVGNRSTVLSRLQALEYLMSLNLDRRAQAQLNCVAVVPGAAGAFRRSTLIEVGGYPSETLVEDTDLTVALLQHGGRIPYEPRAVAWTEAPETAADVLKQRHRWSFGTVQVAAKRSDLLFRRNSGRLGVLALPWLILSQILLPITGPLVDLYLLVLLAQRQWTQAAVIAALSIGADLVVAAVAIHLDRERWRLLWWTPGLRLIWRPLQLAAVIRSGFRWLAGSRQSWRHVQRYGTVVPNL